jgi:hypothetical protein
MLFSFDGETLPSGSFGFGESVHAKIPMADAATIVLVARPLKFILPPRRFERD